MTELGQTFAKLLAERWHVGVADDERADPFHLRLLRPPIAGHPAAALPSMAMKWRRLIRVLVLRPGESLEYIILHTPDRRAR